MTVFSVNYGDCSSTAECTTVARETGVRLPSFALLRSKRTFGKLCFTFALERGKMKILFICKYNAFRSRVAEEYFKKINKNKNIKVLGSRGLVMGGNSDNVQREISKKHLGINIAKRKPLPLTIKDFKEADKVIVVANDIPKVMFNYQNAPIMKKVIIWKIKDEQRRNRKNIKKIVLAIKRKVDRLNRRLK